MSSYNAKQYADQRQTTLLIGRARLDGLCVVCGRRPLALWPNGSQRITCGADECYRRWLRVRTEMPAMVDAESV